MTMIVMTMTTKKNARKLTGRSTET